MAKSKKKYVPEVIATETYYAYFNPETEQFISASNTYNSEFSHYVVITKQDHRDICSGKLKLADLILDKTVEFDGTITYSLITTQLQNAFNFQNTLLEWVSEPPVNDTEFTIEWNKADRQWVFYILDNGRAILEGPMYDSTLVFFVMLETDFDFLIRTFYIKLHDILKAGKLVYNFESKSEDDIGKLSISTRRLFNSYGLKIND
jgi:hypothetical protein